MIKVCPICKGNKLKSNIFCHNKAYLSSAILEKKAFSKVEFTLVCLGLCLNCGFIFNQKFDDRKMRKIYTSKSYIARGILKGKMSRNLSFVFGKICKFINDKAKILEVGCGEGTLALKLSKVAKKIVTVDPSLAFININRPHVHYNTFFSRSVIEREGKFDFVIARYILEHIREPLNFLELLYDSLNDRGILYLELPNMNEIIESERFYDVFNDHFGYFLVAPLTKAAENTGFLLIEKVYMFNKQIIGLFLRRADVGKGGYTFSFPDKYYKKISNMQKNINYLNSLIEKESNSIAIFGASARGVALFNFLKERNQRKIKNILDMDKNKVDLFIPGTDVKVVEPTKKNINQYSVIIIAASMYEDQILNCLNKKLNFHGKIIKNVKEMKIYKG